ncbi:hypothetical protein GCM10017044_28520 [Kordiimonas sediminis]|uniref:Major facilitator superfamily (MFS) profile domain-containing protein n=1 Tax=Kordiimonas sediminis TaxID=1735581 RepID=A0A919AYG2_9PROT|nr:MFS transporter [Kordiimonas sediminis]GHF31308.1 hypothetical protein GCM10017044_28520 [Kordiimonas sediminis]
MTMFRAALVLGLLSAVGPFAIDMYLPAMPAIAEDLRVDAAAVQLTLTVYFILFGIAQLFYGPWADQVGRKIPIYFGVGIFSVASIGCAWAPTLDWLVAFRALQGIGGAVPMVAAITLCALLSLIISIPTLRALQPASNKPA